MATRNADGTIAALSLIEMISDSPDRRELLRDFMSMLGTTARYTDSMDRFTYPTSINSDPDHRDGGSLQLHYDSNGNTTEGFIFEPRNTDGSEPEVTEHFTGPDSIAHVLDYLHG